jgi:hypothetical protein
MATLEQIINEARALSAAEKAKLRQELNRDFEQTESAGPSKPAYQTNERERAWIDANRDEYLGQLVALDGDQLLAHGTDARKVYEAARALGVEAPYIERVEPKVDAFVGGWE